MVPFIFISFSFFSCFFLSLSFFFLFRATPVAYGSFWTRDWIGAHATAIEMLDPSCICDLHYSSLWCQMLTVGPGVEPASSWILVGFITAEPQWKLPIFLFLWNVSHIFLLIPLLGSLSFSSYILGALYRFWINLPLIICISNVFSKFVAYLFNHIFS